LLFLLHLSPALLLIFSFYCSCNLWSLHSFPTRRSSDLFCGQLANTDELHHNRHAWYCAAQLNIGKIARVNADLFGQLPAGHFHRDRKSTRLNSSHVSISYAVFCLKKKRKKTRVESIADR